MVRKLVEKFDPIEISSKLPICGLPLKIDTYNKCTFGCNYCFSKMKYNPDKINDEKYKKKLKIGNINFVKNRLHRIFQKNEFNEYDFKDMFIKNGITWHCGGLSDPFSDYEEKYHITKELINISKNYHIHILFSTKTDNLRDCNLNPELHTFQLSITNVNESCNFESNVPNIKSRIRFFHELKEKGFKVGIRIQPFIPNISNSKIVDCFKDADYFTIEGLKIPVTPFECKKYLLDYFSLNEGMFFNAGLLNLNSGYKLKLYEDAISKLEKYNIPYSIADNELHYLSSGFCCCGDPLINKSTSFNNTALLKKYGRNYTLKDIEKELKGYEKCKINHPLRMLFHGKRKKKLIRFEIGKNSREKTFLLDLFRMNFGNKKSLYSPKYQYYPKEKLMIFDPNNDEL